MRIETTISDNQGRVFTKLAKELGVSRSKLIEEALSLFLLTIFEAKKGNKLVIQSPSDKKLVREILTPSLGLLEWLSNEEEISLSEEESKNLVELLQQKNKPNKKLKKALEEAKA